MKPKPKYHYIVMTAISQLNIMGAPVSLNLMGHGMVALIPMYDDILKARKDYPNDQILTVEILNKGKI